SEAGVVLGHAVLDEHIPALPNANPVAVVVLSSNVAHGDLRCLHEIYCPTPATVDELVLGSVAVHHEILDADILHVTAADDREERLDDAAVGREVIVIEHATQAEPIVAAPGQRGHGAEKTKGILAGNAD